MRSSTSINITVDKKRPVDGGKNEFLRSANAGVGMKTHDGQGDQVGTSREPAEIDAIELHDAKIDSITISAEGEVLFDFREIYTYPQIPSVIEKSGDPARFSSSRV
jgi:hypothetical protein